MSLKNIAIIGMAARMPSADNLSSFWESIKNGRDSILDLPLERKQDIHEYLVFRGKDISGIQYEKGGYLHTIDQFDHDFFGISPREAQLMDPNQRLFLETAWECIEDAGYGEDRIKGTRTGIYLGCGGESVYSHMIDKVCPEFNSISATGNCLPVISGRLAYILDLKGPNITINTVCSSSLVAVHLACTAINNAECDMAIAAGIQLHILPFRKIRLGINAPDGRTKSFDDRADGTGTGEGIGVVLLKPLEMALRDGDNIYAVIKGSHVNHDGNSIGISAPNPLSQEEVIVTAWEKAGIGGETISYFEAHSSGTMLGDTIEMQSLKNAFARYTDKKQFCPIGCIKPNIGHLDAASGIAGLIKSVLCLKYKMIAPMINFACPNRHIDFIQSPVFINDRLREWETNFKYRRCGVNSFGFSGTNCHVVLEEAPSAKVKNDTLSDICILTISAKSIPALEEYIKKYIYHIKHSKGQGYKDICYTSNIGRGHYKYRIAIKARSKKELYEKLIHIKINDVLYAPGMQVGVHKDESFVSDLPDLLKASPANRLTDESADKLCELYRRGLNIGWGKFHNAKERRIVSLPTYPFEKKRNWLVIKQKHENKAAGPISGNVEEVVNKIIAGAFGVKELEGQSNFYELGGSSILAMHIVNKINQEFNIDMKVVELLQNPIIENFVKSVSEKKRIVREENIYEIKRAEIKKQYQLTSAQKRLFIIDKLFARNTAYNMYSIVKIEGKVNVAFFKEIFEKLMLRHEALRTSFGIENNEPVQIIKAEAPLKFDYLESDQDISTIVQRFVKPFNLQEESLFRVLLVKRGLNRYFMLLDMHHIICDGVSINILIRDFTRLYNEEKLEPLDIQYKDYAEWENWFIQTSWLKKQEEYWLEQCRELVKPKPDSKRNYDFQGSVLYYSMDTSLSNKLKLLSVENETTLFITLFAAYNILLYKLTGNEKIVVGTVTSGRHNEQLKDMIGMFVNTLAIVSSPKDNSSIKQFLAETKCIMINAYKNQDYPFDRLVSQLNQNVYNSNPLFETMFLMQDTVETEFNMGDLRCRVMPSNQKTSKFDMLFSLYECGGRINMEINYNTHLYSAEDIERYKSYYIKILNAMTDTAEIHIKDIQ